MYKRRLNDWSKNKMIRDMLDPGTPIDEWVKEVKVIYIQGPNRQDNYNKAVELVAEHGYEEFDNVKYIRHLWRGVSETTGACIYNNFHDSHMEADEFVRFIDYNHHWLNVTYGSVMNNYNLIIITSVQKINEIYPNQPYDPPERWLRRVSTVIDLYEAK